MNIQAKCKHFSLAKLSFTCTIFKFYMHIIQVIKLKTQKIIITQVLMLILNLDAGQPSTNKKL